MDNKEFLNTSLLATDEQELLAYLLSEVGIEVSQKQSIAARSSKEPAPLSFAQQRFWLLTQLEPLSPFYNLPKAIRLKGKLDAGALERSFAEIVRRHEILRTNFVVIDGQPKQVIRGAEALGLVLEDLSVLAPEECEATVTRLAAEEARTPFNLERDLLMRARLLRINVEEHVLLLTTHHIISDAWSTSIFINELGTLYQTFIDGRSASPLEELPIQYTDFAIWQREYLQGDVLRSQLDYWNRQLAEIPPVLALPYDRPRPIVQTFRGALASRTFPRATVEELKTFCRGEGVTMFTMLLAAFKSLLARYTGLSDIFIGTPVAGRNLPELEGLIGCFINMLVLRSDLGGDPSFRAVLERVKETMLDAYAHQDVPFEKLVDELKPERNLSHNPLFQVVFTHQESSHASAGSSGLGIEPLEAEAGTAKFDLILTTTETADGLNATVQYNTDLFDASTIARFLEHFANLLQAAVSNPLLALSELPLLSQDERRLLSGWNETATTYPRNSCIHHLFAQQAARTPDAIALVYGSDEISYAELHERAALLARHLRRLGITCESKVGIMLERRPEMVVSLLAVLMAGGAYVPLDAQYPAERLAWMLKDAGISTLITEAGMRQIVERIGALEAGLPVLWIDEQQTASHTDEATPIDESSEEASADQLAYVIYTSGSTGTPKGVAVPHRAVVRLVSNTNFAHFSEREVFLQLAPVSFDASTLELWAPLLNGGRLVLYPERVLTASELQEVISRHGITAMWLTASLFNSIVAEDAGVLVGLRQLLVGGEALSVAHIRAAQQQLPQTQLINGYGPTENTTFTCCYAIPPLAEVEQREGVWGSIPIGRPISNTQVYILDERMQVVPVGVAGELYIAGDGLARGYLHRAELTAERFVPDPFSLRGGERLYRTGDVVRYLSDGRIEFIGRVDHQVKVRGYRIELGEVEAALMEAGQVRDVVVVVREDVAGDKRLVAYVVADGEVSASELREQLRERLPEYMVPSAIVKLEELPLTENGKVDRRALPVPEAERSGEAEYVGPRTEVEELVAGVWCEVLGVERVSVEENFFELGGHSLLATQVVTRVREVVRVQVPIRSIFESPTVSGFSAAVEAEMRAGQRVQELPITPRGNGVVAPLSFAQQRLWFIDKVNPGNPVYNIPVALRLRGRLDVQSLERCLNEIVRRHEPLRTSFSMRDGQLVQIIAEAQPVAFPVVELQGLPEAEREAAVRRYVAEEAQQPFDLARSPLLRARLLRLSDEEHVALLTMHHIISDGWSMGILVREMAALYAAFSAGLASPLPELEVQYADFAVWQREWSQAGSLDAQLSYWREQLAGAPEVLNLPTDYQRPSVQTFNGATLPFLIPEEIATTLRALSRKSGATLFMTLLAAFKALLSHYVQHDDIVVGTPIANRNRVEVEKLIGFFVNTLVLRTDLSGNPTFEELLRRVREVTLGAYAHQDVPFEKLVEELQPTRSLSHTPLVQVMFSLQNMDTGTLELPGLTLELIEGKSETVKFDLAFNLVESGDAIAGAVSYNTDIYEAATIGRMIEHFKVLLQAVVTDSQVSLTETPLLTERERQQILLEWNDTATGSLDARTMQELLEERVDATPDATAVISGGTSLTYRQLNEKANRLAHHLRGLGVGPGVAVGLCVERSVEAVVGVWGIIKSGGIYVPFDAEHPAERIAFMMEDAQVRVLVTQERFVSALPVGEARVVCFDSDEATLMAERDDNPSKLSTGTDAAYLIFTSGTTGRPKAVVVEQRNLVNTIQTSVRKFGFSSTDVMPLMAALVFDISLFELLTPLLAGGTAIVLERAQILDLPGLARSLEGVTMLHAVPSLMRQVVKLAGDAAAHGWTGERLRHLFVGGDVVPPELLRDMRGTFPQARTNVLYGPTETTIICTSYDVENAEGETRHIIGRPLHNAQILICDRHGKLLPAGIPGEIYIGGAGVTRGYLNRAELTAEKFVAVDGQRFYRSGDKGRYLPDGRIEFIGRLDDQLKVRGFRVEPAEIEVALSTHEKVREAVVLLQKDEHGDALLIAYAVVAQEGEAPTPSELREFLATRLPAYMIPSGFVLLEKLPLTSNGKVDRRALPGWEQVRAQAKEHYVAPRTEIERTIATVWQEALKLEQVGMDNNFFELGGHSLLMVQVHNRLRDVFQREISIVELFKYPTIGALARFLGNQETEVEAETFVRERPRTQQQRDTRKQQRELKQSRRAMRNRRLDESDDND